DRGQTVDRRQRFAPLGHYRFVRDLSSYRGWPITGCLVSVAENYQRFAVQGEGLGDHRRSAAARHHRSETHAPFHACYVANQKSVTSGSLAAWGATGS